MRYKAIIDKEAELIIIGKDIAYKLKIGIINFNKLLYLKGVNSVVALVGYVPNCPIIVYRVIVYISFLVLNIPGTLLLLGRP